MENKDSKKKELEEAAELLKNINFSDNNSNQLQELIKQIHILSNHKEEIEREDFYPTEEKPISYEERLNLIYNMKEIDDDRREFLIKKLNIEFGIPSEGAYHLDGKEVELPRFDFITGKRVVSGQKIKMDDKSILIIEGIHALNPKLTSEIPQNNKYHVFVSAMTQLALDRHNLISSSDNRLLRRIVRDNNYRGYSAQDTIMRWDSVRSGEEKHIFPYQENADSIFNSSLLYEIGVLKPLAEKLLSEVPQNSPAYSEARRLQNFLANFKSITTDYIPPTSIMREFLGGSSFNY